MQATIQVKFDTKEIRDLIIDHAQDQCNIKGGGCQISFMVDDGEVLGAVVSFQHQTKK